MTSPTVAVRSAVTARGLFDYRHAFVLDDDELTAGPILDCPGGASPFAAHPRARGGIVISVDPIYDQPVEDIVGRVTANLAHAPDWLTAHRDSIDWSYLGSPDAHIRASEVAADLFAVDYTAHPEHYVAAALPALPFPDRHFRLALSANLLFVYTQDLSFDDHLAALLELTRVTHEEVRVHPLLDPTGPSTPTSTSSEPR